MVDLGGVEEGRGGGGGGAKPEGPFFFIPTEKFSLRSWGPPPRTSEEIYNRGSERRVEIERLQISFGFLT